MRNPGLRLMSSDLPVSRANRGKLPATLLWIALASAVAFGWAWLALRVQDRFAPVLLFPLLLGVLVGWSARWLTGLVGTPGRTAGWCGVALAALVAAASMHLLSWFDHRRAFEASVANNPHMQLAVAAGSPPPEPPGFMTYLEAQATRGRVWLGGTRRGWAAWLTWGVDGSLMVAGALAAWWFTGHPPPASRRGVRRLADPPGR